MTIKISSPEAVGMSSERLSRIQPKLQTYIDDEKAPGFITLIARKGEVVHYEAFGFRDVEQKLPMEKDTIFRIYSMTKPITSVALMMLYEQGKFHLHDPVSKYIPEFGKTKVFKRMGYAGQELVEQDPPMTIHHLLTHTAGLTYGWFQDNPVEAMYRTRNTDQNKTLEESVKEIAQFPLIFQPGIRWNYSVATDVCGYLVQVISGMPFDEYLQEKIFAPLGMIDTAFHVSDDKAERFAALYAHNPKNGTLQPQDTERNYRLPTKSPSGGGGLVSTMDDYLKFALMLLNRGELDGTRILGRKTVEYMSINHLKPELLPLAIGDVVKINGVGFGLGFSVIVDQTQRQVMASNGAYGWSGAAATNFWVDPEEEVVGIIMTQIMNNMLPLHDDFQVMAYQALID